VRFGLDQGLQQAQRQVAEPGGGVRHRHDPVAGLDVDPQHRDEARHRPGVPRVPAAAGVPQLQAQAVPGRPARPARVVHALRLPHRLDRAAPQHLRAPADDPGPAGEVEHRGPDLPGGGHRAGVVLGFGQHDVRPRVHGQTARGGRDGAHRRAVHAEGFQELRADDVAPGRLPDAAHELAQHAEADVAVVEARPRPVPHRAPPEQGDQGLPVAAGRALPPGTVRLGLHPTGLAEELAHRDAADAVGQFGQVGAQGVLQAHELVLDGAQDRGGHERLGDRPDAVLGVRPGPPGVPGPRVHPRRAHPTAPDERPVAHEPGHDRRQPGGDLPGGEEVVQPAVGAGQQSLRVARGGRGGGGGDRGHAPTLPEPCAARG
jgi:hypothetical protein